jgi:hypothetical protein
MTNLIVKNFVTDFRAVAESTSSYTCPPGNYHFAGDNNLTAGLYKTLTITA